MSPDPGRTYTVGCSFDKLIPDETEQTIRRGDYEHDMLSLLWVLRGMEGGGGEDEKEGEGFAHLPRENMQCIEHRDAIQPFV